MPPSCKLLATVYALDVIKGKITQTDVGREITGGFTTGDWRYEGY